MLHCDANIFREFENTIVINWTFLGDWQAGPLNTKELCFYLGEVALYPYWRWLKGSNNTIAVTQVKIKDIVILVQHVLHWDD